MSLIQKGIQKGYIKFDEERRFITYIHQNKKRNYRNPEEQVQAEAFLNLVLIKQYPVECIKQFVSIKMGTVTKEADIIVYNDKACLEPRIIIECKKQDVSELEFQQAIDQAFSYAYATPQNVKYIWVTSGIKNRYFEFNKDKDEKKDTADIPQFGVNKLAKCKYAKGGLTEALLIKDSLIDEYLEKKQKALPDYQIFMVIADDIGYDATGRSTGNNELEFIGKELKNFINFVEENE